MELFHNQITKAQGMASLRVHHRSFGLPLLAANVDSPVQVLDFPSRRDFIRSLEREPFDIVGISLIVSNFIKAREMARLVRTASSPGRRSSWEATGPPSKGWKAHPLRPRGQGRRHPLAPAAPGRGSGPSHRRTPRSRPRTASASSASLSKTRRPAGARGRLRQRLPVLRHLPFFRQGLHLLFPDRGGAVPARRPHCAQSGKYSEKNGALP